MSNAFVALGSNLADPIQQIHAAVTALAGLPHCHLLQVSPLYTSRPMGPQDQPDYINAVVQLETTLEPLELLDALQQIELAQGRVRKQHWGARTLDLDILLIDNRVLQSDRLTIPHYGMHERAFVLLPLFDIAPDLQLPDGRRIVELVAHCDHAGLIKLAADPHPIRID
jgi:2-amino-4-hydroxy-6-hydroxymethyldihydropteridine diphosphokinase